MNNLLFINFFTAKNRQIESGIAAKGSIQEQTNIVMIAQANIISENFFSSCSGDSIRVPVFCVKKTTR